MTGLVMTDGALPVRTVGDDTTESGEQEAEAAPRYTIGIVTETCIDDECNIGPSTYTLIA
jgi:hypothetical protein